MNSTIQTILVQFIQMVPTLLPKILKLAPSLFVTILVDLGIPQAAAQALVNEAIAILDKQGKTALAEPVDTK